MKKNKIEIVTFKDLYKISDNHLIMMGLSLSEKKYDETLIEINDFFHEMNIINNDGNLIQIRKISGNLTRRHDFVFDFSPNTTISPVGRLLMSDLKWPSDFVYNFFNDYN